MWRGVAKRRRTTDDRRPRRVSRGLRSVVCRLLLLPLLLPLFTCTRTPPVVKIGLVGPFEGRERAIGYDVIYSARLAVRQLNEAGGVNGYRVALVALDDGGNVELARQTAVSLTLDPAIIAVVGHWQPETTAAAAPIYAAAGIPFVPMGERPFGPTDPATLPSDFLTAYAAITPFDETAGPYAATTYDAFQLLWQTLAAAKTPLTRDNTATALFGRKHTGMTGVVSLPN